MAFSAHIRNTISRCSSKPFTLREDSPSWFPRSKYDPYTHTFAVESEEREVNQRAVVVVQDDQIHVTPPIFSEPWHRMRVCSDRSYGQSVFLQPSYWHAVPFDGGKLRSLANLRIIFFDSVSDYIIKSQLLDSLVSDHLPHGNYSQFIN